MRHRGACACAGVPFRVAQRGCGGRAHGCDAPIRRERRPDAGGVGGQVISAASLPSVARGLWLAEAEAEPGGVGGGWPSQSGPRRGCLENASDCACSAADSWQAGVAAGGWAVAVLAALGGAGSKGAVHGQAGRVAGHAGNDAAPGVLAAGRLYQQAAGPGWRRGLPQRCRRSAVRRHAGPPACPGRAGWGVRERRQLYRALRRPARGCPAQAAAAPPRLLPQHHCAGAAGCPCCASYAAKDEHTRAVDGGMSLQGGRGPRRRQLGGRTAQTAAGGPGWHRQAAAAAPGQRALHLRRRCPGPLSSAGRNHLRAQPCSPGASCRRESGEKAGVAVRGAKGGRLAVAGLSATRFR